MSHGPLIFIIAIIFHFSYIGTGAASDRSSSLSESSTLSYDGITYDFGSDVESKFRDLFSLDGDYRVVGGVWSQGKAEFFQRHHQTQSPNKELQKIKISEFQLIAETGSVYIHKKGTDWRYLGFQPERYLLDIHHKLACPLAHFINRDGNLLFTVPPDPDLHKLQRLGLQPVRGTSMDPRRRMIGEAIAKELHNHDLGRLARASDFGPVKLFPEVFERTLIKHINKFIEPVTRRPFPTTYGSYVNLDTPIVYNVILNRHKRTISIEGVPLRLYWKRSIVLGNIDVHAIRYLSKGKHDSKSQLTNFFRSTKPAKPHDIISLFQNAAIFRAFKIDNSELFSSFVREACRERSLISAP